MQADILEFKIDISAGYKSLVIIYSGLCALGISYAAIEQFPIQLKTLLLIFFLLLFCHFTGVIIAKIKFKPECITIHCGLFIHKIIYFNRIEDIYKADYKKENIDQGNPSFSKNIVAIEYDGNKKIFISLKERDEFISAIRTRIDHGQA